MQPVVTAAEARALDRVTMTDVGLPGVVMMEVAGRGVAAEVLRALATRPGPVAVVCGGGGKVQSGNMGWLANLSVGYKKPSKWGEWRAMAGYRYLQTDAVPDAFPDSDFHLGGTNSKGYTIGAALGLTDGVVFSGKWMSANEVSQSDCGWFASATPACTRSVKRPPITITSRSGCVLSHRE